jgi:hypothetical protein
MRRAASCGQLLSAARILRRINFRGVLRFSFSYSICRAAFEGGAVPVGVRDPVSLSGPRLAKDPKSYTLYKANTPFSQVIHLV